MPDYKSSLEKLSAALPVRFQHTIQVVYSHLESILNLPLVLTHNDLSCGNILVEPSTGHITGIVDWADAIVQPFGLVLWGVYGVIGFHGPAGYTFHADVAAHVKLFRATFLQEARYEGKLQVLEMARILGVLQRYGFTWNISERKWDVIHNEADLHFLDACLASLSKLPPGI
jgi:Ser/Thr protein kinase RdoA (MazF antagonist)